jgi:tetratricopeptide (TPR) repeat protein
MPRHKKHRSAAQNPKAKSAAKSEAYPRVVLALILLLAFVAYLPAMNGGRLWDDDAHITKPELQSAAGLYRIWFQLGATQQYYPLLHSAFWLEHKLWGDAMLGYHLVNWLWHALAVLLVYSILRKLQVPGALLAAALFAVHPVMVESVAWVTEQKNTLSAVFYLGAMRAYLDFDQSRQRGRYSLALGLFVLGLLTKTVTATLPAALLVIFWWQRGSLSWRRDVLPLVPFFVLGAIAGLFTAAVERKLIGAEGADFELSLLARALLAGRVIWFYLAKLLWPANLMFMYPRWTIDPAQPWQWIYSIAALATTIALVAIHRRWRAPLAGWLFFCGTLFPVLGFLNVYPFIFSYVADHFQYLASLGVFALSGAGLTLAVRRLPYRFQRAGHAACCLIVGALALVTWRQAHIYRDSETLYRETIARNPDCWLAELNLGTITSKSGRVDEGIAHFRRALEIKPDWADTHSNLGIQLCNKGQLEEGIKHLRQAVTLAPWSTAAHLDFANAMVLSGNFAEAVKYCEKAVEIDPNSAFARFSYGVALSRAKRYDDAAAQHEHAVRLEPDLIRAHHALAQTYATLGRPAEAIAAAERGIHQSRSTADREAVSQLELWLANYRQKTSSE